MKEDLEHLRLLSIFHYVVAGLSGLAACFPIIHLAIGISMLTGNLQICQLMQMDFLFNSLASYLLFCQPH